MKFYTITVIIILIILIITLFTKSDNYSDKDWEETQDKEWKNQVKKVLYKENPIAKKIIDSEIFDERFYFYTADTSIGQIGFQVPIEEGINFNDEEPSQLLIRWLL